MLQQGRVLAEGTGRWLFVGFFVFAAAAFDLASGGSRKAWSRLKGMKCVMVGRFADPR